MHNMLIDQNIMPQGIWNCYTTKMMKDRFKNMPLIAVLDNFRNIEIVKYKKQRAIFIIWLSKEIPKTVLTLRHVSLSEVLTCEYVTVV